MIERVAEARAGMPGRSGETGGGTAGRPNCARQAVTALEGHADERPSMVLEAVVCRENMQRAWQRVCSNRGAAGVDGLTIDPTAERLRTEWPPIREELLAGCYQPQSVRRFAIPKPGGACELWASPRCRAPR